MSTIDLAVCAVCLSKLVEPRQLPCSHVFCTSCLQSEIDLQTQTIIEAGFPCPSCRETVKPATPNVDQSAWAKTFPLVKIVPFKQTQSSLTSDPSFCSVHKDHGKNGFCSECCAVICLKCAKKEHPKCKVLSLKNAVAVVEAKLQSYLNDVTEDKQYMELVHPDLLTNIQNAINCIDDDAARAGKEVKTTAKELVEKVKKKEEEILVDLKTCHEVERRKLEQSYATIDYLNVATAKLSSLQKSSKDLYFLQNAEAFVKELSEKRAEIAEFNGLDKTEVTFLPDKHSLMTLKLGDILVKTNRGVFN